MRLLFAEATDGSALLNLNVKTGSGCLVEGSDKQS
jgi:hypothetical protein